jgi:antitoxin (DNA-binding transcriptional repressor) of toxin-antitoxin stability system
MDKEPVMSLRIGMRELREKLAEYLESSVPIEVTRHGRTIGFYIPVPRRPNQSERDAMLEAGRRMQEELARLGITEEELAADFKAWRKNQDAA